MFASNKHTDLTKILSNNEIAKLFVSATFVYDLHTENWGYIKDKYGINRVILIDLDGANRISHGINEYLFNTHSSLLWKLPSLSTDILKQMIKIYENMKTLPLPKNHDAFHLSHELYKNLIDTYQKLCQTTLEKIRNSTPNKQKEDKFEINKILANEISNIIFKPKSDDQVYKL